MSRRFQSPKNKYTHTKGVQAGLFTNSNTLSRESLYRGNFRILESAFKEAKKDRFDCVGKLDLAASLEKVTGLKDYIDEISRLISHADTHGDGRISFEHYMEAIKERKLAIDESFDGTNKSPTRRRR